MLNGYKNRKNFVKPRTLVFSGLNIYRKFAISMV